MKNKKSKNFNHRKSIASVVLASILAFSFNYTPISLVARHIAAAYKSSTTSSNTFYGNSSVSTENKIDDAKFPSSLEKYFEGSSANFNIETYYKEQYYKFFENYADNFLKTANLPVVGESDPQYYNKEYVNYLNHVGYDSLGEYYEDKKGSDLSKYKTFVAFFEHFVTSETNWTTVGESEDEHSLPAIFTKKILDTFTQPYIYEALAEFLKSQGNPIEGDKIEGNDGLEAATDDVYAKSKQYIRVKVFIDSKIKEFITIYSYDGTTQNNYVAGIIANGAPTSSDHYYEKNKYDEITLPTGVTYETATFPVDDRNEFKNVIYYSTISKEELNNQLAGNATYQKIKDFISNDSIKADMERNPLLYRPLLPNEEGYLGENYPIYLKYKNIPYSRLTSSSQYNLFIVNDDPSEQFLATCDSLQYVSVISSEDLDADMWLDFSAKKLNPDRLYVKIPYSTNTDGDVYFKRLFGNIDSSYLERLIKTVLTDGSGNSCVYLKYNTKTEKIVYVDNNDTTAEQFKKDYPKYSYVVEDIDKSEAGYTADDYYEIDANDFSSYLSAPGFDRSFPLYFKKVKVFYKDLVTDDSAYKKDDSTGSFVYEIVNKPDVSFKMKNTPAKTYETYNSVVNKLYVVSDADVNVEISGSPFVAEKISKDDLKKSENYGFYVKVPAHLLDNITVSDGKTYEFYYKHEAESTKAIFVIDSKSGAANNEVYKNLHYDVISETDYNNAYFNYVIVDKNDPNYNSNFKLYYKYESDLTPPSVGEINDNYKKLFVQNEVTGSNAIYILDTNGVTPTEKVAYARLFYTPIDNTEFNNNSEFYVQLSEQELKQYGDNGRYTKLYYKYKPAVASESRRIYAYSSKTDDTYATFYNTDDDYVASDYVLIERDDPNYVSGKNLFYKRIRNDTPTYDYYNEETYYYYQNKSSANIKLNANGYYVVSFYAYTNGKIVTSAGDKDISASLYVTDTSGILDEIVVDNISTNGTWKKYYAFFQTNPLTASTISLSLYMGNKDGIAGEFQDIASSVSGVVLFDDIKVTLINETDFNKQFIDDTDIATEPKEGETPTFAKQDAYGNEIIAESFPLKYLNNQVINNWNSIFDFDNTASNFVSDDPAYSEFGGSIQSKLIKDYFDSHPDSLEYEDFTDSELWHYYISRGNSGQNKNEFIDYRDSYLNGKVNVSVIDEKTIDKTVEDEDDDKKDDKDDDKKDENDITSVESTFNSDNKVLKIENKDRLRSLGVASAPFEIEQNAYYKITVWVFSPDKDATATIIAESVIGTGSTPDKGSLISTSANVNANIKGYSTKPTNEYGWIPITFYIEGNAYADESIYLVLLADKNQTIYFDNISIEKVTSSIYTTISSDSDNTTHCLSLSPSSMLISRGITNGYFNSVNVTDNYNDIDYSKPRTAKNWSEQKTNSTEVIAGVIPSSDKYIDNNPTNNFYYLYNGNTFPFNRTETRYANNVFGIYAPSSISAPIEGADENKTFNVNHNYRIYSSSTSLSSNKVYEISFDFYAGKDFNGKMVANLYAGAVNNNRVLASFATKYSGKGSGWETYTFVVQTGVSSQSVYLEIGIEDASGTCFFQKAKSIDQTTTMNFSSIEVARDYYVDQKADMNKLGFANLRNMTGTIHENEPDENGIYGSGEYSSSLKDTSSYTTGKSGTVVADLYDKTTKIDHWTVKYTDKVTYYIKQVETEKEDGSTEKVYKLYSDSVFTKELTRIDGKKFEIRESSSGKSIKLIVGNSETSYDATAVNKTDYLYKFNEDAVIGNTIIPKEELTNNISENLFIIANDKSTDYSSYSPIYTKTLSTSSYYVLKIYVKTSEIVSFNSGSDAGLNINIKSISTSWNNISTVGVEAEENNGFVCYRVLISTNKSSVTNFGVEFSLGSEKNPCTGYAIIAGVELESFSSEALFNEYAETLPEDDKTVKRFYGETSSKNDDDDNKDNEAMSTWATFFYIFSSLLLGLVLIIALVAVIIKRHPLKNKKTKAVDNIVLTDSKPEPQVKKKSKKTSNKTTEEVETELSDGDDGFV